MKSEDLTPLVDCRDSQYYRDYPGMLICAQEHEDSHVREDAFIKCPPCGTFHLRYTSRRAQRQMECPKYQAQRDCLATQHKNDCGTIYDPDQDPFTMTVCELAYWQAITNLEAIMRILRCEDQ